MKRKQKNSPFPFALRLFTCGLALTIVAYSYVDKQNKLTEMRRIIPKLEKEVKNLVEVNRRFQFEIDHFENPIHLIELARKPEYSHLRFPRLDEIIIVTPDYNEHERE